MKTAIRFAVCLSVLMLAASPSPAQEPDPDGQVEEIIDALSVEERVGQLFMVDFVGSGAESDEVIELIRDYKVGGVFLSASNRNIANDIENTNYNHVILLQYK